jgi:diguanylate cyclase (GGDEF)-like protein
MADPKTTLFVSEPDPRVLKYLARAEHIALGTVIAIAILNLTLSFLPLAQELTASNWRLMTGESVLFALMSALSLLLLQPRRAQRTEWTGWILALIVLALCGVIVTGRVVHPSFWSPPVSSALKSSWLSSARISTAAASGFALIGLSMVFLRATSRAAIFFADLFTACQVIVVLVLLVAQLIEISHVFGTSTGAGRSLQTSVCLFLLAAVTFCRRARRGVFSIFLGYGTGSKVARGLSPVLLLAPYLRELSRAYIIGGKTMPPPYITAVLATLVVIVGVAIMLYLAWRINSMESEIHSLSLRDELTGLCNLRGFRLLAEQGLRMANRSQHPFSVLFVDLDDMKKINDRYGHIAGSQCLVDAAEILRSVYREADVLGRIGGDEFAVAGEFAEPGMVFAIGRLEEVIKHWNEQPNRQIPLGLSFGSATSSAGAQETLDSLLERADQVMYEHKRKKKNLTGEMTPR